MAGLKQMNISRLTKKYQATIPSAARKALGVEPGDSVVFEIEAGQVIVKKASDVDWNYLQAVSNTLSEWNSAADEEAYSDL